jgi:hypothetical protein
MKNQGYQNDYFKICLTTLPPANRARQLYTTGVPMPFEVVISWRVRDVKLMERIMHMILILTRVNTRREFFAAPLQLISEIGDAVQAFVESTF